MKLANYNSKLQPIQQHNGGQIYSQGDQPGHGEVRNQMYAGSAGGNRSKSGGDESGKCNSNLDSFEGRKYEESQRSR